MLETHTGRMFVRKMTIFAKSHRVLAFFALTLAARSAPAQITSEVRLLADHFSFLPVQCDSAEQLPVYRRGLYHRSPLGR